MFSVGLPSVCRLLPDNVLVNIPYKKTSVIRGHVLRKRRLGCLLFCHQNKSVNNTWHYLRCEIFAPSGWEWERTYGFRIRTGFRKVLS
jgi:hypothetical protein